MEILLRDALSNQVSRTTMESISGQNVINLSLQGIPSGLYYVSVTSSEGTVTKKIMVAGK